MSLIFAYGYICLCVCACVLTDVGSPFRLLLMLRRSWEESLPVAVKGLFISTCYWPLSAGPLHNNGTGTTVECKVIDVGLYLALLPTGAPKGSGSPSLPLRLPCIVKADRSLLRNPILTACQSAQKTIWQCRVNTASRLINQSATTRDRLKFIYAT